MQPILQAEAAAVGGSLETAQAWSENTPWGMSPQQIRTAYAFLDIASGAIQANGTGQTIAIVDAYDDPDLLDSSDADFSSSDLAQFDQQYGLPSPPSFVKINEQGQFRGPARYRSLGTRDARKLGGRGGPGRGMDPRHGPGGLDRPGRVQLEQ